MKVIHIASECAPFAKSGGLGDVVYGLSKMTHQLGVKTEVIIPHYKHQNPPVKKDLLIRFDLSLQGDSFEVFVYKTLFHEITIYTIDSTHQNKLFARPQIYGENDDIHRFLCFSFFALNFLMRQNDSDNFVLHLHDWPTGICSFFLPHLFPQLKSRNKGTLFTIHNLKHQGITKKEALHEFGIPDSSILFDYLDTENTHYLNILKISIDTASHCTTVSPTYLKEIQTPEFGEGLNRFIQKRISRFSAVLNGIDTDYWNPEKDPYLHRNYRKTALIEEICEEKYRNKHYLRKHLGLKIVHEPLFIFITRLVHQKAPHLIAEAIHQIEKRGAQCILLGSEPSIEYQNLFHQLTNSSLVHLEFSFQESLAHLCYAAADAIIIPSLFEPCGLTQLIAMNYGTVPIVRKTGGLSDTVFDIEHSTVAPQERNGFTFEYPTLDSMDYIIDRSLNCFHRDPTSWKELMKAGFLKDVSFKNPAKAYLDLYKKIEINAP